MPERIVAQDEAVHQAEAVGAPRGHAVRGMGFDFMDMGESSMLGRLSV